MIEQEAFEAGRAAAISVRRFVDDVLKIPVSEKPRAQWIRGFLMYGGTQKEIDEAPTPSWSETFAQSTPDELDYWLNEIETSHCYDSRELTLALVELLRVGRNEPD